jgi:hypothetical protein
MSVSFRTALAAVAVLMTLVFAAGCSGPAPAPDGKKLSPQEVVVSYWTNIDSGNFSGAYDLVYFGEMNVSREQWAEDRSVTWGNNGSDFTIYSFMIISNTSVDPATFPGNFTGAEAIMVYTDVCYNGRNTSGVTQFAVVNTPEGWKMYGP